jgi:hypothetical protein
MVGRAGWTWRRDDLLSVLVLILGCMVQVSRTVGVVMVVMV